MTLSVGREIAKTGRPSLQNYKRSRKHGTQSCKVTAWKSLPHGVFNWRAEMTNGEIAKGIFETTWLVINYGIEPKDKTKKKHYEFMFKKFVEALDSKDTTLERLEKECADLKKMVLTGHLLEEYHAAVRTVAELRAENELLSSGVKCNAEHRRLFLTLKKLSAERDSLKGEVERLTKVCADWANQTVYGPDITKLQAENQSLIAENERFKNHLKLLTLLKKELQNLITQEIYPSEDFATPKGLLPHFYMLKIERQEAQTLLQLLESL